MTRYVVIRVRKMTDTNDIKAMEFEQAMAELEKIVASLENGTVTLKDSVSMYERGVLLKKHCERILDSARMVIQQISSENKEEA